MAPNGLILSQFPFFPSLIPQNFLMFQSNNNKYQSKMGTLAAKIENEKDFQNENIVKVQTKSKLLDNSFSEAEGFSRISKKTNNIYHHIGIYCYSAETLEKFVELKQTKNEIEQRLEQLRALDNSIKINVALAKSPPRGVDTEEDYMALKKIMEYKDQ